MGVEYKVISIGALSHNIYWNEDKILRSPHATTTLVVSGNKKIIVDPALPANVLNARLNERAGICLHEITDVFLTTFRSAHRGALSAFEHANWYIHEAEKEYARVQLQDFYRRSREGNPEQQRIAEDDIALLERCKPAPEKLADQVSIFPSPGASAGCCGLLLTPPVGAVVIAGDAVINSEYLEHGRVWDESFDIAQAQDSLRDILEVADLIIPGHDNIIPLLGKMM
jgi:glyoxylase-like metal-dependent hydrolase (beta-lactamase superfamily II)